MNKERILKESRCVMCKTKKDLEMHHAFPLDKRCSKKRGPKYSIKEASKCVTLCKKCHKKVHTEKLSEIIKRYKKDLVYAVGQKSRDILSCTKSLISNHSRI